LQGTCTETNLGFFLAPAIQTPDYADEESFSESQALPPIDDGEINFDDTQTGNIPFNIDDSLALNLDESIEVSEDDVAIELGEIMPIDLDQLDSTQLIKDADLESTSSFDLDTSKEDVDLDLTGAFSDDSVELDLGDALSDIDFTDTTSPEDASLGDSTVALDLDSGLTDIDLTDTFTSDDLDVTGKLDEPLVPEELPDDLSLGEESVQDLDEELLAELAEGTDDTTLDSSAIEDLTGDFPEITAVEGAALDFDESIELKTDEEVLFDTESEIEDLTGEFPALADSELTDEELDVLIDDVGEELIAAEEITLEEDEDSSLNLEDIDVSDLVASSSAEDTGSFSGDDFDSSADIDLTSLMDESPDDTHDGLSDELDLEMLDDEELAPIETGGLELGSLDEQQLQAEPALDNEDEDIPEIELVAEDEEEDEGPPDLPS